MRRKTPVSWRLITLPTNLPASQLARNLREKNWTACRINIIKEVKHLNKTFEKKATSYVRKNRPARVTIMQSITLREKKNNHLHHRATRISRHGFFFFFFNKIIYSNPLIHKCIKHRNKSRGIKHSSAPLAHRSTILHGHMCSFQGLNESRAQVERTTFTVLVLLKLIDMSEAVTPSRRNMSLPLFFFFFSQGRDPLNTASRL
ncbi:hypothetical protein PUN28_001616 [Cardiocondyla obscurior]|uniref:Uncharacterized protein n=1 Tax=Cardiocondyla obscurior TaxID=286306 RepID=A0AAW2GQD1_9HYME